MSDVAPVPQVQLQVATEAQQLPDELRVGEWVHTALLRAKRATPDDAAITVRFVDESESENLNSNFRGINKPTNVLAFPASIDAHVQVSDEAAELGDLVICAQVVAREAAEQDKTADAHYAHMTVHGVLHLLGYDHGDATEAMTMESLEKEILAELGYPDPYRDDDRSVTGN